MERLTVRIDGKVCLQRGIEWGGEATFKLQQDARERLADYEDTGLTPEEIMALKSGESLSDAAPDEPAAGRSEETGLGIKDVSADAEDAIKYMEGLVEYIPDEMLPAHEQTLNALRGIVARDVPVEPKHERVSYVENVYTCVKCGATLSGGLAQYCSICGQRARDFFHLSKTGA